MGCRTVVSQQNKVLGLFLNKLDDVIPHRFQLAARRAETVGTKPWHQTPSGTPNALEVPDVIGEPWRSRTSNLLIKSPLQAPPDNTQDDLSPQEPEDQG